MVHIQATLSDFGGYDLVQTVIPSGFGGFPTEPIVTELGYNLELTVLDTTTSAELKLHCTEIGFKPDSGRKHS